MKCISTFDAIFSEPLFKYLQVLNNRFTMVPVFKLREKIIEIENWVFIIVVFSIELIADLCIRDNKGNLYTSTLFGWKNNEIFALMFDLFLSKSFQGRVLSWKSGMQFRVGIGVPRFSFETPRLWSKTHTIFHWRLQDFLSETPEMSSETPAFHHWPPNFHWGCNIFMGDPNLFIGDPKIFIGDPHVFIKDPINNRSPIKTLTFGGLR